MRQRVLKSVQDCIRAAQCLQSDEAITFIEDTAALIAECFRSGGKLLIAGNGGSLCDAAHFAEELTGNFRKPRAALPAIAITDAGHITCTANDYGFERIFSRAIEAYGKRGDVFVVLSTSGNSSNLTFAVDEALRRGLSVVTLLGKTGGALKSRGDSEWIVTGFETSDRIQEAHMAAIHIIIEQIEALLFGEVCEPEILCLSADV